MIEEVRKIEKRLNDGVDRTPEEHEKCFQWLMEFMIANDMSLRELDELCRKDSVWVFDQIF